MHGHEEFQKCFQRGFKFATSRTNICNVLFMKKPSKHMFCYSNQDHNYTSDNFCDNKQEWEDYVRINVS